jgi:hypothetical protein
MKFTLALGCLLGLLLTAGSALAATIHAPVVNQFSVAQDNVDRWFMIADGSGTVSVEIFTQPGLLGANVSLQSSSGSVSAFAPAGITSSLSLTGLVPGSVVHLDVSQAQFSYRPTFNGVSQVYIEEASNSPNDLVNFGPIAVNPGSNIVLGYDGAFASLPGASTQALWHYALGAGDTFAWSAFFDDWPIGADAVSIEVFDPFGVSQFLISGSSLLGNGTVFSTLVALDQAGFWQVALTAPSDFLTAPPGNYLMDVTVNGDPTSEASNRHYLLPNTTPPIPEPATLLLLGMGVAALARRRMGARRRPHQT